MPTFTVKVRDKTSADGPVPIRFLASTLQNVRDGVMEVARSLLETGTLTAKERKDRLASLEPIFVETRPGSVEAVCSIPDEPRPIGAPSFASKVLADYEEATLAAEEGDIERVRMILPSPRRQRGFAKSIRRMATADDAYSAELRSSGSVVPLKLPATEYVEAIESGSGMEHLRHEEVVDIEGRAVAIMEEGTDPRVKRWIDLRRVRRVEPGLFDSDFAPDKVEWQGRRFFLKEPLDCETASEEGRSIITYAPLRIVAWGESLDAAKEDFSDSFAFLWDTYAVAADAALTESGIAFKSLLRSLVEKVEA